MGIMGFKDLLVYSLLSLKAQLKPTGMQLQQSLGKVKIRCARLRDCFLIFVVCWFTFTYSGGLMTLLW